MSKDGDQASKNNIKFTEQDTENEFESKLKHKLNLTFSIKSRTL